MTHKRPRILAIDDTPANLFTLGMALEQEFDVQVATSGRQGLLLAEQVPPDLILLDIMMPEMDGFETCRRLKANPVLQSIPVIFVSALAEIESESKGLALGAADYITKPVNVDIARMRIRNLIEREVLRQSVVSQRDELARNVTERQHNQLRLEQVMLEQKAMLDNDLIGIVKVSDRTIIWANPAFEKMMGYSSGEMAGMPTRKNYVDNSAYLALGAVAYPLVSDGGVFRGEIEKLRKNGERIWVELSGGSLNRSSDESLWTFIDISVRRRAEEELKQLLSFGMALNQIAQNVIDGDTREAILHLTCDIVGRVLGLDRALIYEVSEAQWTARGLCEWLNPAHVDLQPSISTFSLDIFKGGFTEMLGTRSHLSSRHDQVNPCLVADGSGQLLHQDMKIQSLLWFPFNFSDGSFHLLALNQVYSCRDWTPQELTFLDAVGRQVSIALSKMQLLDAQAKAREKIELAASVFTHAREGITINKLDGTIVEVNNAFTRITGYSREEALGQNPRMLNSGRQNREFYANLWRQLQDKGHWYGELWNRRKNGELYAEMLTVTTVRDALGNAENYVALFTDITAFKEHEDKLQHIAHYDALTNLPNRVLLADRLCQGMIQEQRRGKKLAVVFIDLDGFKAVNDAHGHAMGDLLLVNLASRMKLALREGDTLARIGGDEFVAVLGDLDDIQGAVPVLTRLLSTAAQEVVINAVPLQVSASVGVTFYPQTQEVEADQLLRQADQSMYQAKLAGKNRYNIFDAQEDSGIRSFHESIERIRQGLANGEFVMHYQPKVNMLTGTVIGAEALVRWQHPQSGLLAPGLFLPAIDNHPLAVEVGEWVIDTTLTQIEAWQAQGIALSVSVNVGARQIQQPDFVVRLRKILEAHPRVNPTCLEIEILETSALEDLERVSQVIEDCRALGVTFAMDDFGTGYSSLTYLRRLRVNLLKIDQSFVRDMLDDVEDLTILQGVIGLAKSFRRSAIAEGVESVAHGKLLLQLGCELAQGYGIARPMPASELPDWLTHWKPDASWSEESVIAPEHIPFLYAGIEHRAWVAVMGAHLRGERPAPPLMDSHLCNFGMWFEGDCQLCQGNIPTMQLVNTLHQEIHALGNELVSLQANGRNAEALAQFPELERLRDLLLAQLDVLAHSKITA